MWDRTPSPAPNTKSIVGDSIMLHFNQDYENIFLWHMLQNIYYFGDKENLALAQGLLIGRVCALRGYGKYSQEEVDRVLELASTIAQQRRKQIINGGI